MTTIIHATDNLIAFWIINSLFVFVLSVFCAGVLIPQILLISFRKRLFDVPDERKIHQGVVPRLGGIAFKPVVLFSVVLSFGISQTLGFGEFLGDIVLESRPLAFGFCAILVLYLVGIADDLIGIRYRAKFIIQILCGVMLIAGGLGITELYGILFIDTMPEWVGYPLTVFAVVFIINAINLIDGIDGLASGLCGVAMLFYGVTFMLVHEYLYALFAFATLGVLVPFFYYNVFGDAHKQKKIFMGDTGSLSIGIIICVLSLRMIHQFPVGTTDIKSNPFILAYSPLIVPCFDVVRVYLHRVRNGKNPFLPDKNHIHHKLLAIGLQQRTAMVTIVAVSVCFTLCNILLSRYVDATVLLASDILIWTLGNLWLTRKILQHSKL